MGLLLEEIMAFVVVAVLLTVLMFVVSIYDKGFRFYGEFSILFKISAFLFVFLTFPIGFLVVIAVASDFDRGWGPLFVVSFVLTGPHSAFQILIHSIIWGK